MDNMGQQKMPIKISQEISECNNAWMLYLQGLAGLCSAGARVSHSLQALAHGMPVGASANYYRSSWEELLKATQAATLTVRTEIIAGLRELAVSEETNSRANEQIISSNLSTLLNLQYQFCVACCECLGQIGAPEGNSTQQQATPQQQQQQISPSSGDGAGYRQHQLFTRLLGGQRRWSEVATRRTAELDENGDEGAPRRWSVPWEGPGAGGVTQHQLTVPLMAHERSSRSTTPDSASLASQEELQEVISLLSCRPVTQIHPSNRQLPGVTLTNCSHMDSQNSWPPVPLFPRDGNAGGGWYQSAIPDGVHQYGSESGASSSQSKRGSSPRPSHHRARPGWTPHEPLYNTIWGEQEGEQASGNMDMFLTSNPENNCVSYQRKSSSSTDSSSSSSLPQHNTINVAPDQQLQQQQHQRPSHLYSMWSGSEMAPALPFLQLPSSPNHSDSTGTMLP